MPLPIATPPSNLALILSRYATYGTTTWWTARGYPNSIPTLTWTAGNAYAQELSVRGAAMNALALAVNNPTNVTSARLIAAVARQHVSNPAVPGAQTWGRSWQSPLWAATVGLAAFVGWDAIPNSIERDNIRRMLIDEANYVVANRPSLFWKDGAGVELRPGDSAAEENGWCAMVLWMAAGLMPTAPDVVGWKTHALDLAQTAFAPPGQDPRGSNVTATNLVVNHSRIHPDYSTTASQLLFGYVVERLAGRNGGGLIFDVVPAWTALVTSPLDTAGTFAYNGDSPTVNFPVGTPNDWGNRRPAAYAVLDGLVARYGLTQNDAAGFYASIHLADVMSMQARNANGAFTTLASEGNYPEENAYTASQIAFLALAR